MSRLIPSSILIGRNTFDIRTVGAIIRTYVTSLVQYN